MNILKNKISKDSNIRDVLYSFDVFDTIFTRSVAEPPAIFSLMQNVLMTDNSFFDIPVIVRKNFFTIRTESESFIRANKYITSDIVEITLDDIYNAIKSNYNLSDDEIERLKELEITTEIKNIVPIQETINQIKDYLQDKKRVVLISDMYLSERQIRRLLVSIDEIFEDVKIYVSSELNKTKNNGSLYEYIKQKENIDYCNWYHIGDNWAVDVKKARNKNINANLLEKEPLMPYEARYLWEKIEDADFQLSIGVSRLARRLSKDKSNVYRFGASFAGPLLFGYVKWVLNEALINDVKTLYFVARDGFILKEIADVIIKERNLNIKTKYIYASRKVWRVANEYNIDKYLFAMCSEYKDRFSTAFLAKRLELSKEEFTRLTGLEYNSKILSKNSIENLFKKLINNTKLKQVLIDKDKFKNELSIKYLKQELDINDKNIWFVDVQGSSKTQDILIRTLKSFCNNNFVFFYFGLDLSAALGNMERKRIYFTVPYLKHWMELLCRTPEGQTVGYKEQNGYILPIKEKLNHNNLLKWGFNSYVEAVRDYSKLILAFEQKNNVNLASYSLCKKYFEYFFFSLDRNTADLLGSVPMVILGSENTQQEAAPVFGFFDYFKILFGINVDTNYLDRISYIRSNKYFRSLRKFLDKHGSLRKFFFEFYKNNEEKEAYLKILGQKITLKKCFGWRV